MCVKWNPEADSHTYSQPIFSNGKGYSSTVRNSLIEFLKSGTTLTSHTMYEINLKCIVALNVEIKTKKLIEKLFMILEWSNVSFRYKALAIKEKLHVGFHPNLEKLLLKIYY